MERPIMVIGHLNPDTDSICSAIAYAYLKKQMGADTIPARAGKINPETEFVLNYFGVEEPFLVSDVWPRISDLKIKKTPSVLPEASLREVGKMLAEEHLRAIPVVEEDGKLVGMIAVKDIAMRYYDEMSIQDMQEVGISYKSIIKVLEGTLYAGDLNKVFNGKIKIGASKPETISIGLAPTDLVIIGDRIDGQLAALTAGAEALILTRDTEITDEVLRIAKQEGALVISTPFDTYTATRLINQSVPVKAFMTSKNLVTFLPGNLLSEAKKQIAATDYICYPVLEKGKYIGTIDQECVMYPPRQQLILVDHNERSQMVEGSEDANIIEIIDHHRLGGLSTNAPIFIRQEPVGCTATIIANLFFNYGINIPKQIAGLLVSAVISDTLLFRSPTATPVDKIVVEKLVKIAEIDDLEKYAMELLRHGTVIDTMTPAELVRNDIKEFDLGDYKIGVAQINIMDREYAKKKYADIESALEDLRVDDGYDLALLLITDILGQNSDLLAVGEPQKFVEQAFGTRTDEGYFFLPGCLSRKKQVIPVLTELIH
ncbi:MAG TPA: putative manganese-dependent inorganic diphosphatase [Candidatus Avacidaminococcus intestinavium]|uniref:inorganic diphosphatase n=1 Tax=Candidatus Avacidaminococcus intestinavium TaxID=2840684 RepID=A0A9D1MPR9_9FIRM|nr:putative manganese-dependent inorganic diphosphatase [Candidatus Avacidaminococcus intestinavium]